jgi:hypothetical protein
LENRRRTDVTHPLFPTASTGRANRPVNRGRDLWEERPQPHE